MMLLRLLLVLLVAAPPHVLSQVASGTHTPSVGACPPDFNLIRDAGSSDASCRLSAAENAYIQARRLEVLPGAWASYLQSVKNTQAPLPDYVSAILGSGSAPWSHTPTLGIAVSGGGYRAAIFGAGAMNALDGRNATSQGAGTGGLLQAASYVSGLSGGSWLVGSLAQADFPMLGDLVKGWNAKFDPLQPTKDATKDAGFFQALVAEIRGKHDVGFQISFADIWSRALSRHFVSGTDENNFFDPALPHGAGVTLSSIAELPSFLSHSQPFPIIVSNILSNRGDPSRIIPGLLVPLTNPIVEFNVFETGSFDPQLNAFVPTKYLGTQNSSVCVTGFDQASFVLGTSSNIFNAFNSSTEGIVNPIVAPAFQGLGALIPQEGTRLDVAHYPNPFISQTVGAGGFIDNQESVLELVDGGEDGQNIPLQPLLVKDRQVDVILAIDASSDTLDHFANGTALIVSRNRTILFPEAYEFPPVPTDPGTFISQGLATRPTFFGCETSSTSPIIVYLANGGPPRNGAAPLTNTTTDQTVYDAALIQGMMDQTFEVVVQGSGGADGSGRDAEWPACLACAVVDKARARSGMTRRGVCETCFQRYCYVPEGRESVLAAEGALSGAASVAGRRVDKGGALGAMLAVACLVGVLMV